MDRLRFGVVGCGVISTEYHLPAFQRCDQLDLRAVADVDGAWASTVATRFGAPESSRDHRALIGRVDAALVATPNATHADIACDLLAQGIHVLCEKPIATTRRDVDRMLAAQGSEARLMVAHNYRFSPNLMMLKTAIDAGWFGPLVSMSGGLGGPYDRVASRTDFRRRRGLSGGGVLIDLGVHLIDVAIWLAGELPLEVAYEGSTAEGWEVERDAEVALRFASAGTAHLSASFSRAVDAAFVVRGEAGWARASMYEPGQLTFFSRLSRVCRRGGVHELTFPEVPLYARLYDRQIEHFCHAVKTRAPFRVPAEEMRAGIDVVESCYGTKVAA